MTGKRGLLDISGMLLLGSKLIPQFSTDPSWVMIFNANLDKSASNRKNTKELRIELKNWEDSRKRRHLVDNTTTHVVGLPFLPLLRMLIASRS